MTTHMMTVPTDMVLHPGSDAKPTVYQAWSRVMGDVQAVGKDGWNPDQKFKFRGIDAVMNAVGPVLRKHGVIVIPEALDLRSERYTTGKGTAMKSATVLMRYTVIGPAGDQFTGSVWGEAADSSDKAVSKAESVAYRVFLLQGLTIPTCEPDPDESTHERAGLADVVAAARAAETREQITAAWAMARESNYLDIAIGNGDTVRSVLNAAIDKVKAIEAQEAATNTQSTTTDEENQG